MPLDDKLTMRILKSIKDVEADYNVKVDDKSRIEWDDFTDRFPKIDQELLYTHVYEAGMKGYLIHTLTKVDSKSGKVCVGRIYGITSYGKEYIRESRRNSIKERTYRFKKFYQSINNFLKSPVGTIVALVVGSAIIYWLGFN